MISHPGKPGIRNDKIITNMKIENLYTFKNEKQIWRLLLTTSDKLLIETRDTDNKEVFFSCLDANTGKPIFENFQLDEIFWIGIETTYKEVIFFHKFAKPDMPGHKEIIALDLNTQKILWQTDEYAFLFIYDEKVYSFKQLFEGQKFFSLNYKTGELIEELESDYSRIDDLSGKSEIENHYDDYIFPLKYSDEFIDNEEIRNIINEKTSGAKVTGDVEYNIYENLLLMNFHNKVLEGTLENKFWAVDIKSKNELFEVILNSDANAFVPDSFFIYKNLLFLLKGKKEVVVCRIE